MTRTLLLPALVALGFIPVALAQGAGPRPGPADTALEKLIDEQIDAQLKSENVQAVVQADDPTLLRRVTLDLVGRVPTLHETKEYLADTSADRKTRLLDRLMASPAFVRYQAEEFLTLLQGEDRSKSAPLLGYLRSAFAENRSWDRVFRELLLPDDSDPKTQGSSTFLKTRVKDVNRLATDVSSIFFGVNISCAQCHDHPHVPDWTQDHFYGMKSFFARTFEKDGLIGEYDAGVIKYIPNKGVEKAAPVMFLTGKKIDAPNLRDPNGEEKKLAQQRLDQAKKNKKTPELPKVSLRAALVDTALEPGQRDFFARAIVNRLWYRFLGRGLVMPLDQMHSSNPASHPELLDALARDLTEHDYDLRRLVRGIVSSRVYSRNSRWEGNKLPREQLFAVAQVRPLTPQQLAVSLKLTALDPESLPRTPADLDKKMDALEKSASKLADQFPQPTERFQVSTTEALLFANNEELQRDLLQGPGRLVSRMLQLPETRDRADLAVQVVLGRPARGQELQTLTEYLKGRQDRAESACQQVVWALMTTAEFRFNH
jgi:hypothetical protein